MDMGGRGEGEDGTNGWDGGEVEGRCKWEGAYVYLRLIHVAVWQKPTQYLKQLSFNQK